ncbi:class I SAM-dependent methyltransferase [Actinoplanes sp. NPDC051494]|uniref:class I SAM-dependent methyltransferase n=1 Tax=Actinoplanes sp. NPDC051494 TaxID=3363907 RepID=UPI0037AF7877
MTTVLTSPDTPAVDARRWPDLATVPSGRVRARIAARLFRRITSRLALRVAYPGNRVTGTTGPAMRIVRPAAFFARLGAGGLIGFGEAYQAGDWEADDLVGVLTVFAQRMGTLVPPRLQWLRHLHGTRAPRADRNTREGSRRNIHRHYDLSNELFALFLDPSMSYSSALFDTSDDLTTAQHRKIDRLLDATGTGPGSRVLEIGTGWGELAIRAARRGAQVLSVTLSAEQRTLALQRAAEAGVPDRVEVRLCDYREIEPVAGGYDAILSVEMIEAVGAAYWPAYASALERHLAPGGRIGLQMITIAHERMLETRHNYTWIHKYVFPGGLVPSIPAIEAVLGDAGLAVRDRLDFGADYATTLRHWRTAFEARPAQVAALGFDETFARTWTFYLAYCEAGFAAGYIDVSQLVIGRTS